MAWTMQVHHECVGTIVDELGRVSACPRSKSVERVALSSIRRNTV